MKPVRGAVYYNCVLCTVLQPEGFGGERPEHPRHTQHGAVATSPFKRREPLQRAPVHDRLQNGLVQEGLGDGGRRSGLQPLL